ncbi:hypothetical protein V495_04924, partial [Pseudogymnoascus sp. VKM F-4514 (FW-929)]
WIGMGMGKEKERDNAGVTGVQKRKQGARCGTDLVQNRSLEPSGAARSERDFFPAYRRPGKPAKKQRRIDAAIACDAIPVAAGCPWIQYRAVDRSAFPKAVPVANNSSPDSGPTPPRQSILVLRRSTKGGKIVPAPNAKETKEHAADAAKPIRPRPTPPRQSILVLRRSTKGGKIVPARHVRVAVRP